MSGDGTIGEVEAPPKRRIFLRKRLVIAVSSIFLLLGGSGAAALYIGTDKILGKSEEELGGLDCKDVARIAIKRNDNQIWLHKYVKTDSTDGPTRIKTAIRVATGMAEKLRADMIHIVVLDQNGPTKRSEFKDLAFGAEVFYVRKVGSVPGFENTFTATYAVGSAAANGLFYGKRRELTSDQVVTLARLMENRADCLPTDEEKAKMEAAEKAASHGKKEGHEAKPAEAPAHGEEKAPEPPADPALAAESKLDEALGIKPPPPPVEEAKAEPDAKKDKGFLDSMLGMVGLGSKDEAPKDADGQAAPAAGEGHAIPADGEGHAAPAEGDGHAAPAEGEGHGATAEGEHDPHEKKLPPSAVDLKIPEKPVEEKSMFSSLMGMVGLGGDEKAVPEATGHGAADGEAGGHQAPSAEGEGHGSSPDAPGTVEGESALTPDHSVAPEGHDTTELPHEAGADAGDNAAPAETAAESHSAPVDAHGGGAEKMAPAAPAEEPTDEELAKMKAVAEPHQ